MRVLTARGGELEQDFGYGVVRQLYDAPLAAMTAAQRRRLLNGAAALAAPALSSVEGAAAAAALSSRASVLHGLYWLTANLAADRPLVVAIDDAHWADSASLAFLSYLARRVEGLALFVVYATRVGEGASEALPAFADASFSGVVLRPDVLGEQATIALIERSLASASCPEFARACRVATAGNPFLLQELLRALHADGIAPARESCARVAQIAPDTISRAILARLRRLGAPATELAFAIAVLGRSAELRHAAALAGLEPEAAGRAADALTRAAIVHDRRPLEFIHPIVRTTIYGEIPVARRAASHKRAAALLACDAVPAAELAPHLMAGEPAGDPGVVRGLRAAAAEVRDRGAPEAACAYLTRALAEPPTGHARAEVLHELGSAELPAGRPEAIGHLRDALAGDLRIGPRVAAALELVSAFTVHGQRHDGLELLDPLVAQIEAGGDSELAMQIDGLIAGSSHLNGTRAEIIRARLGRYRHVRGETLGEQLLLSAMAFDACHRDGPATRAIELAEGALSEPRRLLESYPHSTGFPLAAWALVLADQLERADGLYTFALDNARARGSLIGLGIASGCRCQVRFRLGRLPEAEAEARGALDPWGRAWVLGRPMMIACVLDAMVERADAEACRSFLAEQGIPEDLDAVLMASRLLYSRGHMRLEHGDPAGALRDFEQIRTRDAASGTETAGVPDARIGCPRSSPARQPRQCAGPRRRRAGASARLGDAQRALVRAAGGRHRLRRRRRARPAARGGSRRRAIAGALRAGAFAHRVRGGAAPRRSAQRCARAPARGAGTGRRVRRATRGRPGERGAAGDGGAAAPGGPQRRRRAHAQRAPRRPPRRRRDEQPRDRPSAVRHRPHGGGPPHAVLHEARHHRPRAARDGARLKRRRRPRLGSREGDPG